VGNRGEDIGTSGDVRQQNNRESITSKLSIPDPRPNPRLSAVPARLLLIRALVAAYDFHITVLSPEAEVPNEQQEEPALRGAIPASTPACATPA
jgi:hypothetical protein